MTFKTISAKDLLRFEIKPFLFGVLFSRIMAEPSKSNVPDYFYVYTDFSKSKAVFKADFSFENYAPKLVVQYNKLSGHENWTAYNVSETNIVLRLYIKNDIGATLTSFSDLVYKGLIKSDWLYENELTENKKLFVRGYMESRGSVDTTAKFISQDYFYNNQTELKRVQVLTDRILPIEYANFNPRNLQPQYVAGTNKRNNQFRINLFYYASEIGFINEYKAQVFENAYPVSKDKVLKNGVIYFDVSLPEVRSKDADIKFLKMLFFFANNIDGKELTATMVETLRKQLGFTNKNESLATRRDQSIIKIFTNMTEEKCACCNTTKTFLRPDGTQGFEIHHFIPVYNNISYDNIANLVKLCATCHSSLKKGRATKDEQIKNMITIMHKHPAVFEYAKSALGLDDIHEIGEQIQKMLG